MRGGVRWWGDLVSLARSRTFAQLSTSPFKLLHQILDFGLLCLESLFCDDKLPFERDDIRLFNDQRLVADDGLQELLLGDLLLVREAELREQFLSTEHPVSKFWFYAPGREENAIFPYTPCNPRGHSPNQLG